MASTERRRRKPRGTAKNRKPLYLEVDPVTIAKIEAIADGLGRSKAAVLDLILAQHDVADDGRPDFWTGPLAADLNEELPLTG